MGRPVLHQVHLQQKLLNIVQGHQMELQIDQLLGKEIKNVIFIPRALIIKMIQSSIKIRSLIDPGKFLPDLDLLRTSWGKISVTVVRYMSVTFGSFSSGRDLSDDVTEKPLHDLYLRLHSPQLVHTVIFAVSSHPPPRTSAPRVPAASASAPRM